MAKNYIKGWKWPKVQSGQKWPKVVKMIKSDQNDQTWSKGRTQLKQLKFDIKNRDAELFALQKGESSKIEVKCELFIILMWWLWDEQRPLKKKEEDSLFCQRLSKKSLWIHYIRHNISKSLAAFCSSIKRANDDGVYYRVSQHVWNRLNIIFWSTEACIRRIRSFRRNVFCSKKLRFWAFLANC